MALLLDEMARLALSSGALKIVEIDIDVKMASDETKAAINSPEGLARPCETCHDVMRHSYLWMSKSCIWLFGMTQ